MKILFIAPKVFNLHKPMIEELQRQGNEVDFIGDVMFTHDNGFKSKSKIKKLTDYILHNNDKTEKKYWKALFEQKDIYKKRYDLCLCVNAYCIGNYFIDNIKRMNPGIRLVLYLWDSLHFFDFKRNFKYFDKVYTFDYEDSLNNAEAKFLPLYWLPIKSSEEVIYDVSLIGSHHDDRLKIAEEIAHQLDEHNLNYYFKIVCTCNAKWSPTLIKAYIKAKIIGSKSSMRDIKIMVGEESHPLISRNFYSIEDTSRIISLSKCVLDTDRPSQSGLTSRFMWAIGQGKKIITTNSSIKKMPFYDENSILVVDRNSPVIDIDFIKKENKREPHPFLMKSRLDNFIRELIS